MADGSTKPIEEVVPGDEVMADDPEDAGPVESRKVTAVLENYTHRLVHIAIDADGDGQSDGELRATGEHPIWTQNRGWQNAEDIRAGDILQGKDEEAVAVLDAWSQKETSKTYPDLPRSWNESFAPQETRLRRTVNRPRRPKTSSPQKPAGRDQRSCYGDAESDSKGLKLKTTEG